MIKLLFLLLFLSNLVITWIAWRQPILEDPVYVDINLPRVSVLQLSSELPPVAGAEAPADLDEIFEEPVRDYGEPVAPEPAETEPAPPIAEVQPAVVAIAAQEDEASAIAVPDPEVSGGVIAKAAQCVVVSGFEGPDSAQAWLESNGDEAITAELGERAISDDPLHWVLVPPLSSRAEGQALLNKLVRQDIDSYLITKPPYRNAISLGLYRSKSAAKSVLRRRQEEGIDAILAEYPRERQAYFVALLVADQAAISGRIGEKLTASVERGTCRVLQ